MGSVSVSAYHQRCFNLYFPVRGPQGLSATENALYNLRVHRQVDGVRAESLTLRMLPETTDLRPRWGYFCAISAQVIWGVFPLFYSLLTSIESYELVAHRAFWAFLMVGSLMLYWSRNPTANKAPIREFQAALTNPRSLGLIAAATILIVTNWLTFVWAVTHQRSLEASLGYYICPQVNVLLGVCVLGERLTALQWGAVGLAAGGVFYISSFSDGIPWVALIMAGSFGTYSLIKKKVPLSAIPGLSFETGLLVVPAIAVFFYRGSVMGESLIASPWWLNGLLVFSGLMTVTPLALYATALKHIPLSTAGLLQFVGPTLQFFSGAFLLGESFNRARLIGFIFVWCGVVLFLYSSRSKIRR